MQKQLTADLKKQNREMLLSNTSGSQKVRELQIGFQTAYAECAILFDNPDFWTFSLRNPFTTDYLPVQVRSAENIFYEERKNQNKGADTVSSVERTGKEIAFSQTLTVREDIPANKGIQLKYDQGNAYPAGGISEENENPQTVLGQENYHPDKHKKSDEKRYAQEQTSADSFEKNHLYLNEKNRDGAADMSGISESKQTRSAGQPDTLSEEPQHSISDYERANFFVNTEMDRFISGFSDTIRFLGNQNLSVPYQDAGDFNYIEIAGFREKGGSVEAGKNYIVGEKGPELLMMQNSPGTVIPSDKVGTNQSFSVVFENINITTGPGQSRESVIRQLKDALNELAETEFRAETGIIKD